LIENIGDRRFAGFDSLTSRYGSANIVESFRSGYHRGFRRITTTRGAECACRVGRDRSFWPRSRRSQLARSPHSEAGALRATEGGAGLAVAVGCGTPAEAAYAGRPQSTGLAKMAMNDGLEIFASMAFRLTRV